MNGIIQVLMERDGLEYDDAAGMLAEARAAVEDGEDPEEVLLEYFGLEPDYIFDLF
jgi:hypothetical protein